MKSGLIRFVFAGMLVAGTGVAMAEEGVATPKAADAVAAPKAADAVAAPKAADVVASPKANAGAKESHKRTTWKGVLSAPAADAAAGVIAVLTDPRGAVSKAYNLTSADAEVAAKIKDAAGKGESVVVNGDMNAEKTAIAVTKMYAAPAGDKAKGAGRHERPAAPVVVAPVAPAAPAAPVAPAAVK
ncbi:MAG: hypothetical protein ACOYOU_01115 [Kiritimatiellia bacterium]